MIPVELPGREKRFAEPALADLDELVAVLTSELLGVFDEADSVALFGHSFGAILAYETACAFRGHMPDADLTLIVSGSPPPGVLRGTRISGRPDDQFIAGVRAIAGYHHPALDDPELRELLLPTLRADVEMHENYRFVHTGPVSFPVISVRGSRDDVVSSSAAARWRELTTADFWLEQLDGGHMYLVDSAAQLISLLERRLCAAGLAS